MSPIDGRTRHDTSAVPADLGHSDEDHGDASTRHQPGDTRPGVTP